MHHHFFISHLIYSIVQRHICVNLAIYSDTRKESTLKQFSHRHNVILNLLCFSTYICIPSQGFYADNIPAGQALGGIVCDEENQLLPTGFHRMEMRLPDCIGAISGYQLQTWVRIPRLVLGCKLEMS